MNSAWTAGLRTPFWHWRRWSTWAQAGGLLAVPVRRFDARHALLVPCTKSLFQASPSLRASPCSCTDGKHAGGWRQDSACGAIGAGADGIQAGGIPALSAGRVHARHAIRHAPAEGSISLITALKCFAVSFRVHCISSDPADQNDPSSLPIA